MAVTAKTVRDLLIYDASTGVFTWRVTTNARAKAGTVAGCVRNHYRSIGVDGERHYAHRLAWLWVHGEWPTDQIDHINRIKTDNRIANLRQVTPAENMQNSLKHSNNTSGFKGVSFSKQTGNWVASIRDGKKRGLGHFDTPEKAAQAYASAAAALHKFNPSAFELEAAGV
jgi:hypothetical protein